MASRYLQGKFKPLNPQKYIGEVDDIVYRSSWERSAMLFMDSTPEILRWNSEGTVIYYISPLDNAKHRYFTDFTAYIRQADKTVKKFIIEIKPFSETRPPRKGGGAKAEETYSRAVKTWLVNQAKWAYARDWCKTNGYEFVILTEKEIFPNQEPYKAKRKTTKKR